MSCLRRLGLLTAAFVGSVFVLLAAAAPASADGPLRLDEQLTDRSEVLGSRRAQAQEALDALRRDTGLQLFVVFVPDFDGTPAREWADETAVRSDLGDRDGLLAVATRERAYATSFDQDYPLTDAQLAQVEAEAIEPALAQNDWAGAVVAAADGYRAVLAGEPVPPPVITPGSPDTGGGGGGGALVGGLVAAGVVGAAGVGGVVWYRRRRASRAAAATAPAPGEPTTEELAARANALLVDLDNELRSSEQELAIARGQYGEEATAAFTAALESARGEVTEAFRLRMSLDEPGRDGAPPADEAARRAALGEIIRRCEAADQGLDAEADAFDRLREIEPKVEEMGAALAARRTDLEGRIPAAQSTVDGLAARYTGQGVAAVGGNPAQARERLAFADAALARAREAAAGGRRPEAALAVRAAEEALGQADTLLAGVDQAGRDLDTARAAVDALLAEVEAEVAAGRSAGPDPDGALPAAVAAGAQAASAVRAGLAAPTTDPQADLRRLQEADAALDRALASSREATERVARAGGQLAQALPVARAEVAAASDYLTTRRGAVGEQPRTLLAEAQRQLARAEALAAGDPVAALAAAQEATRLAVSSGQAARTEVDAWSGGGYGSGYGRNDAGEAFLGALIGGILSGGGGSRGGWGGGGWSGGFGGSASRSRRGGGGGSRRGGGGRF